MNSKENRVLVSALDWGLGHATRTVPIIRRLQDEGKEVILASAGRAFDFYRNYFPELQTVRKPGYNIRYYTNLPTALSVILQVPKILFAIVRERIWMNRFVREFQPAEIISDNCYGLWNREIKSVFITHQLGIVCPPSLKDYESILRKLVSFFVRKYHTCLVPDFEGFDKLAGRMSHPEKIPANVKYIGPLSRFTGRDFPASEEKYDVVIVLSGPEPQRSKFEKVIVAKLTESNLHACIIRGIPGNTHRKTEKNITLYDHLEDEAFAGILKSASRIICRSGYSTIMDLHVLGLKALLIPTPGQTEQEYLAGYLSLRGFESRKEDELMLSDFMPKQRVSNVNES